MGKKIWIPLISAVLGTVLFVVWMNSWHSPIHIPSSQIDVGWRTIEKNNGSWKRSSFDAKKSGFVSYQDTGILIYGQGPIPKLGTTGKIHITFPEGGQWIVRTIDPAMHVIIKGSGVESTLQGVGGVFLDTNKKILANFDGKVLLNGTSGEILPSFLTREGKVEFFDILEQKDLLPEDLWMLYTTFFPRDRVRILGNVTKSDIDKMIKSFLEREPKIRKDRFHHDLRVRTSLEEITLIIQQIHVGEPCGADYVSCFSLLTETLNRYVSTFPEVFVPLRRAIQSWIQLDINAQKIKNSWRDVFYFYHAGLMNGDKNAKVTRDKKILDMVRLSSSESTYESWTYLNYIFAHEKMGSAYSLQIMNEMIRVGGDIFSDPKTDEKLKRTMLTSALTSLENLKSILENTYFTKKEYWFELRKDIRDSEGNLVQTEILVEHLEQLLRSVNESSLFRSENLEQEKIRTIKSQLSWFNCIFSRNEEYKVNPRVCRTTK